MEQEIWKPILEAKYQVSNLGRVKHTRFNRILKGNLDKDGYLRTNIGGKTFRIHRLIALELVEGDTTLQINHKDGDKTNNKASNLEWCTCQENITHACENGLRNPDRGEDHYKCIHSDETISLIREALKVKKGKDVATEFNVSKKYVSKIKHNHIRKTSLV